MSSWGHTNNIRHQAALLGLIAVVVCCLGVSTSTSAAAPSPGNPKAAAVVRAKVLRAMPWARRLFVRCPGANRDPSEDGYIQINCEFRALHGSLVVHGESFVRMKNGRWYEASPFVTEKAPKDWRDCVERDLSRPSRGHIPRRLRAHGIGCSLARVLAIDVRHYAISRVLLPAQITVRFYVLGTIGFVLHTFHCHRRVKVLQGVENPFGRERATCRAPFGDRFAYTFDQHS
jgi:hypothetical protein